MALLKSAWEIALEKTADIAADPDKIRAESTVTEARRLAGSYLSEIESDGTHIEKAYSKADKERQILLKKGLSSTVVLNLALPHTDDYKLRVDKLIHIAKIIDGQESQSANLISQIGTFMGKYVEARNSLLERARAQYQPIYEQKREQLMQQYGSSANYSLDQDPEFIQLLQNSYSKL
ncbi:MAG: hypothetical protein RBT41_12405, partial [Clostridia bacterium]|nr:hypothetical protein [Clostridia bacterium]